MKNIILSSDGTGNSGGKGHGTNVWRLHTAIDRQNHLRNSNNIRQIALYNDGVGTESNKWLKILGGAFGLGLKRTIKELYTFLVNNYEKGDQIYLFGFSRGAYTVRLLAGMILGCGILRKENYTQSSDEDLEIDIEVVYRHLQELIMQKKEAHLFENKKGLALLHSLRLKFKKHSTKTETFEKLNTDINTGIKIRFIGVWDTVDAYAIPSDALAKALDIFFYISFREHDNNLHESVESACHALSIDDQRRIFEPVLWRENNDSNDHQRIKQVWFSGMHSNVGGGYAKQGMAWNTIEWMMLHAKEAGIQFVNEDILQYSENKDVHDKMYDSRSGFGAYYVYKPRNISRLWQTYASKISKPQIHISVFERIVTRTEGYAPQNLPEEFEIITFRTKCTDNDKEKDQDETYCAQYDTQDIQALEQQVSLAIKERIAKKTAPTFSAKFTDFIHRWSSYLFFFGMSAFWLVGYIAFEKTIKTFGLAFFFSIVYWFALWRIARRDRISKHKEDSAFWRKVSSDRVWDFLKR